MKSEFALAFNQICAQYNLPREVVLDAVQAALATAYKRDWKVPQTQNINVEINLDTGLAHIFAEQTVVETVEDPQIQISLADARRHNSRIQLGEVIVMDVTPHDFGRLAAQTAKQVITQRLREAERDSDYLRVNRQAKQIMIGTIQSITPQGITLSMERTEEAHMPRYEQIPGEHYEHHQKIRVYVLEVRRTPRGPEMIVSRSHPDMLAKLLELEVPEILQTTVVIKAIAREAGSRSKVAVESRQPGLDPVGACVGNHASRVQTIIRELHGERIDIVEWNADPERYITNALSVRSPIYVTLDEHNPGGPTASVVAADEHLSLAIGRLGQNAKLAAKLTGWRIDIQGASEAALWALEQVNTTPELVDWMRDAASLVPRLAALVRSHESEQMPYTEHEMSTIGNTVKAVRQAVIDRRNADRPDLQQTRARRTAQRSADEARVKAKKAAMQRVPGAAYKVPLSELGLPPKVYSHLIDSGLSNVGEVLERIANGDDELLVISGVGVKALREIKQAIEASGLGLLEEAEAEAVPVEAAPAVVEEPVAAVEPAQVVAEAESPVPEPVAEEQAEEIVVPVAEGEPVSVEISASVEAAPAGAAEQEAEPAQPAVPAQEPTELAPETYVDEEDEGDLDDERPGGARRGRKSKKRKSRAVFYDDSTGETIVVRKHRRDTGAWTEYGDE